MRVCCKRQLLRIYLPLIPRKGGGAATTAKRRKRRRKYLLPGQCIPTFLTHILNRFYSRPKGTSSGRRKSNHETGMQCLIYARMRTSSVTCLRLHVSPLAENCKARLLAAEQKKKKSYDARTVLPGINGAQASAGGKIVQISCKKLHRGTRFRASFSSLAEHVLLFRE